MKVMTKSAIRQEILHTETYLLVAVERAAAASARAEKYLKRIAFLKRKLK